MNIYLLVIDLIFLPFTLTRWFFIYFWGSRYGINGLKFLDVMNHAENSYFNQEGSPTIDTIDTDIRTVIKNDTRIFDVEIEPKPKLESEVKQPNSPFQNKNTNENGLVEKENINKFINQNNLFIENESIKEEKPKLINMLDYSSYNNNHLHIDAETSPSDINTDIDVEELDDDEDKYDLNKVISNLMDEIKVD
jgi:hypothetical protein